MYILFAIRKWIWSIYCALFTTGEDKFALHTGTSSSSSFCFLTNMLMATLQLVTSNNNEIEAMLSTKIIEYNKTKPISSLHIRNPR